jgi:hypothetical protein
MSNCLLSLPSARTPVFTKGPAAPRARLWRTETILFVSLWLVLMALGGSNLFGDPGSLWHIVVGERILSSGELIHTDPFSFTHGGEPWIAQWWLFECGLALLHRVAGLSAILLAAATAMAGLFTWIAHRLLRRGIHPLVAVLLAMLGLLASAYHLHPRPHLATIILVGWTFARLLDFDAGRIARRGLLWLVPVFVLWANMHGGMLGGVAMLGVAVAGWGLSRLLGLPSPLVSFRDLLPLGLLVLAGALTPLVNPYGLELPRVWLALIGSPVLPRLIQEHAPLLNSGGVAWTVVILAAVYLAALAGVPFARLRVTWLMPLLWLGLTWTRIRYGPLFAVTAALALAEMLPHVRWRAWLARKGSKASRIRVPSPAAPGLRGTWKPALVPASLLLVAIALQVSGVRFPVLGAGWARPHPEMYPMELLPELREYERSHPPGTPVFNDMLLGGFLIYHTPGLRIFIDDRCELYGDEGLLRYAKAILLEPSQMDDWQQEYQFQLALLVPGSPFDRYARDATDSWTLVRETQTANLYRHKEPYGNCRGVR